MPLVEYKFELKEDLRKEVDKLIPDFAEELIKIREQIQKEVGDIVSDVVSKVVESIIVLLTTLIKTFGFLAGEFEVHKELGKREALARDPITLLSPTETVVAYFKGIITRNEVNEILKPQGYSDENIDRLIELSQHVMGVSEVVNAFFQGWISRDEAISILRKSGYPEDYAELILNSSNPPLSPREYLELWLRGDINEDELNYNLSRSGFNEYDIEGLKRLAFFIPPAQDLIRMAVREVFTPEVAERFGQYEDFPEAFAEWGRKIGISEEWAKAYWAAHWDLPSPTMGFEMLHRGIISEDELKMLLRALDVMPYWRDKLIQLSYNPLTRVDVRRMYRTGVLDRDEVYRAYLDLGYSPENAERLTRFTEVEAIEDEKELSKTEAMAAFEAGMITESEVREYLKALRYNDEQIDILIALSEYKREKKIKDAKIKAIRLKFLNNVLTEAQTLTKLSRLALSSVEIDIYIESWKADKEAKTQKLSIAELKDALKSRLISQDEFRNRLRDYGYLDDDIDIMIKLVLKGTK